MKEAGTSTVLPAEKVTGFALAPEQGDAAQKITF
jgi:hypothetical protein